MDELRYFLIEQYVAINDIANLEEVKEGYLSQNYIVHTDKDKYFLKQYRDVYTEEEIKDVHKVGEIFYEHNIPIILPIKNSLNQTYFIFNNKKYSLFPFIEGIKADRENITLDAISSIAHTLAKIHLISINGSPIEISHKDSFINTENFFNGSAKIFNILNAIEDKTEFDKLALKTMELKRYLLKQNEELIKSFKEVKDDLLHGDYHDKNIFLDNNQGVKYVFDLEKTKLGDRLQELIRSMDYIFLNGNYSKEHIENAKRYVHTYYDIYPFDKEALINTLKGYWLKKATSLWIFNTHYIEKSNRIDCFLENELALLEYFPKNYMDLADILMSNI